MTRMNSENPSYRVNFGKYHIRYYRLENIKSLKLSLKIIYSLDMSQIIWLIFYDKFENRIIRLLKVNLPVIF